MLTKQLHSWALVLSMLLGPCLYAADCPSMSKDTPERITNYLSQRLVSGQRTQPSIVSISLLTNSCYRKLTIEIPSAAQPVIMYLSPDERFLASTLYDLSADPSQEVTRIAAEVEKLLLQDEAASGISGEKLRIIEFGDFECPYCKQFAGWYQTLPNALRSKTILIFKHLPLDQHPWARTAALYAACTKLQSTAAFSRLSSFYLESQDQITSENIGVKTMSTLSSANLDFRLLTACVSNGEGAKILERHEALARQLNITGTPTVFINGKRILTIHSEGELRSVLERELQQITNTPELQRTQEAQP